MLRSFFKCVAVMCLLLTFLSALALVAHHHPKGTESMCAVCVAAHSAAPVAVTSLLHITFSAIQTLQAEPLSAKGRVTAFSLSVRPPPAV